MPQQELQVQRKRELEKKQERTIPSRIFLPVTDIFETAEALMVVMELPGVRKESVEIGVENDVLLINGSDRFLEI